MITPKELIGQIVKEALARKRKKPMPQPEEEGPGLPTKLLGMLRGAGNFLTATPTVNIEDSVYNPYTALLSEYYPYE